MKDKERKFGNLENKLKDMEDEQLIALRQNRDGRETLADFRFVDNHVAFEIDCRDCAAGTVGDVGALPVNRDSDRAAELRCGSELFVCI